MPGVLSQVAFRGRNDDGSETTATWKAAVNTNFAQVVATPFRIRFEVQETSGVGTGLQFFGQTMYRLNSGTWTVLSNTSSVIQSVASAVVSNGTSTTDQLAVGTGLFNPGEFDSNNGIAGTGATQDANAHCEHEYCMQIIDADTTDGDLIEVRIRHNAGADLDNYAQIPVITVGAGAVQALRPDGDLATTGWSTAPLWSKVDEETADATVITATMS